MSEEMRNGHSDDSSNEDAPLLSNDSRYFRPIHPRVVSPIIAEDDDSITIRQPLTYTHQVGHGNIQTSAMINRYRYYGRLEPQSNSSLIMPNHVVPANFCTVIPITVEFGKQSSLVTIFSIWNTMMGTSILSMPYALEKAGFGLGLFLMVFMAGVMLYTSYLIMKSSQSIDKIGSTSVDFSVVCRHYLGRWAEILSVIFSLVSLLGAIVVYWVLMSNFLYHSVAFVYDKLTLGNSSIANFSSVNGSDYADVMCHLPSTNASNVPLPGSFYSIWTQSLSVPLFLVVFVLPLINFKSATFFTKFNSLGTLAIAYIITFVSYKSAKWGFHADFSSQDPIVGIPEFQTTFAIQTGILSLAFFVHNCVISIMCHQRNPEHNGRDLSIAFICVSSTYIFVAVFFYLCFPLPKNCIADNLLDNFHSSDIMAFVARIFLFFQMMTVFPLLTYIFRIQIFYTILNDVYPGWKHVLALNCVIILVSVVVAIKLPRIGLLIGFAGAFCGVMYVFTLPGVVDIVSRYRRQESVGAIRIVVHVIIFLIGISNLVGQFIMSAKVSPPDQH